MQKIVINVCFGGFGISDLAIERYAEIKEIKIYKSSERAIFGYRYYLCPEEEYLQIQEEDRGSLNPYSRTNKLYFSYYDLERTDPILVQIVEELGEASYGVYSELRIVEVPDDVSYLIEDYDGNERIAESHRTWS